MVSDELDTSGMIKWGNVITSSNRSARISPIVSGTCTNFGLRYFSKVLKIACTRPGQIALSDALSILPKVTGQSKTDNMWSYSSSILLTFVSAASISDMVKYYFILCKAAVEVSNEMVSNLVNSRGTYSSTYRLAMTSTVVRTAVWTRVRILNIKNLLRRIKMELKSFVQQCKIFILNLHKYLICIMIIIQHDYTKFACRK